MARPKDFDRLQRQEGSRRLSLQPVSVYVTYEQEDYLKTVPNKAEFIRQALAEKIARMSK